jgi:drug/metabolite transporter (DMT)-like permease
MKLNKNLVGHLLALVTIIIWGTTFISTKVLLRDFNPIEILFYRFIIGFIALIIIYPSRLKTSTRKHEWLFAGAGLCGITLYYLLENIALTYSTASNVGVLVSISPFFIAISVHWFLKDEKLKSNFFIGFLIAIVGIFFISFNGSVNLKLNPLGDILAIVAAAVWGLYSVLTRKISNHGYNTIQSTRRMFFYGILFMMVSLFFYDFSFNTELILKPVNLFNIVFLGLAASALCFVTWNYAVKLMGAVKTSIYIYIIPIVTVVTSMIVLHEKLTWMIALGTILTLSGLFISERKTKVENV